MTVEAIIRDFVRHARTISFQRGYDDSSLTALVSVVPLDPLHRPCGGRLTAVVRKVRGASVEFVTSELPEVATSVRAWLPVRRGAEAEVVLNLQSVERADDRLIRIRAKVAEHEAQRFGAACESRRVTP